MIISKTFAEDMNVFLRASSAKWSYGNKVLYDMCAEHPEHTDADVIVGKIWLIGRSYAAAIERRKGATEHSGDFYYDVVAPKMLSIGKELDERLEGLRHYPYPTDSTLNEMLNTHKFLMDAFYDITNMEKRSLASKYLHFHCPNMFYIYDSRASQEMRKLIKPNRDDVLRHSSCSCDKEYADFSVRVLELQNIVERRCGRVFLPRELDNFLLHF